MSLPDPTGSTAEDETADIIFLPILTQGKSVREMELLQAQIKSHAAKVSHKKRKKPKRHQEPRRILASAPKLDTNEMQLHPRFGSVDPFDAFPIKITPRMNQIVAFSRDVRLPNLYIGSFIRRITLGASKSVTFKGVESLVGGRFVVDHLNKFSRGSESFALAWIGAQLSSLIQLSPQGSDSELVLLELSENLKQYLILEKISRTSEFSMHECTSLSSHPGWI